MAISPDGDERSLRRNALRNTPEDQ